MEQVRPAVSKGLGLQGSFKDGPWSFRICSLVVMTPIYATLLLIVGTVFGRHAYFRHFSVKMWSRFGIPPEMIDSSWHTTKKNFRKWQQIGHCECRLNKVILIFSRTPSMDIREQSEQRFLRMLYEQERSILFLGILTSNIIRLFWFSRTRRATRIYPTYNLPCIVNSSSLVHLKETKNDLYFVSYANFVIAFPLSTSYLNLQLS